MRVRVCVERVCTWVCSSGRQTPLTSFCRYRTKVNLRSFYREGERGNRNLVVCCVLWCDWFFFYNVKISFYYFIIFLFPSRDRVVFRKYVFFFCLYFYFPHCCLLSLLSCWSTLAFGDPFLPHNWSTYSRELTLCELLFLQIIEIQLPKHKLITCAFPAYSAHTHIHTHMWRYMYHSIYCNRIRKSTNCKCERSSSLTARNELNCDIRSK